MSLSERDRREIFTGFERSHGEEFANNIMELLPQQPVDQLVTRADMHATSAELRGEMAELRSELRGEMAELRGEMSELRGELRGEMAALAAELRGEMAELRAEVKSELKDQLSTAKVETQRLIGASMAANAIAVVTALIV